MFDLGSGTANRLSSLNSNVAVWRIGVNDIKDNPDRSWTLIDYVLSGAHLRNVTSNDASFVQYYNSGENNSTRMENFTRISGNNARPKITEMLDVTNADKYVRALGVVPEGRNLEGRPFWTGEVWGSFDRLSVDGQTSQIRSSGSFANSLVRSYILEHLYEQETGVRDVFGSLQLRKADGSFLRAGDSYTLTELWRGDTADSSVRISATDTIPQTVVVRDVVPPVPAAVDRAIVPAGHVNFSGTWVLADEYDNGPALGEAGIQAMIRSAGGNYRALEGAGEVRANGSWTFSAADSGEVRAGDSIAIILVDDVGNANPLLTTPLRDMVLPAATRISVVDPGEIATVSFDVQYYFDGVHQERFDQEMSRFVTDMVFEQDVLLAPEDVPEFYMLDPDNPFAPQLPVLAEELAGQTLKVFYVTDFDKLPPITGLAVDNKDGQAAAAATGVCTLLALGGLAYTRRYRNGSRKDEE